MTVKVQIVDDSLIFRSLLAEIMAEIPELKICSSVRNGRLALEDIAKSQPQLVTLDLEMPEMDGLETLAEIKKLNDSLGKAEQIYPVMLSSFTKKGAQKTIAALRAGAVDFIEKPQGPDPDLNRKIIKVKLKKIVQSLFHIKSSPRAPIQRTDLAQEHIQRKAKVSTQANTKAASDYKALFIGSSTGGPKLLFEILPQISAEISCPIFIVQHMPEEFTPQLAAGLNKKCHSEVLEAKTGMLVEDKKIYLAPGAQHMLVKKNSKGRLEIICNQQEPENGHRPSADILFRSAAQAYAHKSLALILTGMGSDGCKGLQTLKRKSAYIIAQDEASSVVWGMPGAAVHAGCVDEILPATEISSRIIEILKGK